MSVCLWAAILFAVTPSAQAGVKSLLIGIDSFGSATFNDIFAAPDARFDLAHSGFTSTAPSLSTMLNYDSILMWSDLPPSTALLDDLAAYADAGGGVVLATFAGFHEAQGITGRINTSGYNPLINPSLDAYVGRSLGAFDANHRLFEDVHSISATFYTGDYLPGLDTGATLVGSWSDGRPLAAINATGKVATITLAPIASILLQATGDQQQLFRNALAFTANPNLTATVPEPTSLAVFMLLGCGLVPRVRNRQRKR